MELNEYIQIQNRPPFKPLRSKQVKGIEGTGMDLLAKATLSITIANITIKQDFHLVERLEAKALLGLDFLEHPRLNPHSIDFHKRTMEIRGTPVTLFEPKTKKGRTNSIETRSDWAICNIATTTISARTETSITAQIKDWTDQKALVQIDGGEIEGLMFPHIITVPDKNGNFQLPIINLQQFETKIYANQTLTQGEDLDDFQCSIIHEQLTDLEKRENRQPHKSSLKGQLPKKERKTQVTFSRCLTTNLKEPQQTRYPDPITHEYPPCDHHEQCNKSHVNNIKISNKLRPEQAKKFQDLLEKRSHSFATDPMDIGYCSLSPAHIKMLDPRPVYVRNYRHAYQDSQVIEELIQKLESQGVVSRCISPYNAPCLIVPKKQPNTYRLCINYKKLNEGMENDNYPLPHIQDLMHSLSGKTVFSTLDLTSAFFSLKLDEASRQVTSFSHKGISYCFNRAPMGCKVSPQAFSRAIDLALSGLLGSHCACFLDDVVVASKNIDEHVNHLDEVLERFERYGFRVSTEKSAIAQTRIKFLGHVIDKDGLHVATDKIEKILDLKRPTNISEVRSFLGAATYWSRFIPGFQMTAKPLYNLLRKESGAFHWSSACEEAMDKLKQALTEAPILRLPDWDAPFIVEVDSSLDGTGACLMQHFDKNDPESILMPIAYGSKLFTKNESKLPTNTREALGLLFACIYFKPFIYRAKFPFDLHTDHKSNQHLFSSPNLSERMKRVREKLSDFGEFRIIWREGRSMKISDMMSRLGIKGEKETSNPDVERSEIVEEKNDIMESYNITLFGFPDSPLWNLTQTISRQRLIDEQANDPDLSDTIERLSEQQFVGDYRSIDGLLCKEISANNTRLEVPVIPSNMISDILMLFHDSSEFGGHTGVAKTISKLKSRAFWRGIDQHVTDWISSCSVCQTTKRRNKKIQDILHSISVEKPKMSEIQMDVIGPINPPSTSGQAYILNIQCCFTKWNLPIAMENTTSETIIQCFLNFWVSAHGCPRIIRADNASYWTSGLWDRMCKLLGCKMIYGEPYVHRTQGGIERSNRSVMSHLRTFVATHPEDWCKWLQLAQLPWRLSATNTGFSPAFLLYNQDLITPMENVLNVPSETILDYPDIVERSAQVMKFVSKEVLQNIKKSQQSQAKQYDKKAHQPLKIGSLVRRYPDVVKGKLQPTLMRKGPYRCLDLDKRGKAQIQIITKEQEPFWIHLNKLATTQELVPMLYRSQEEKKEAEDQPRRSSRIADKRAQLNEIFNQAST
jgi:hypothetical protein